MTQEGLRGLEKLLLDMRMVVLLHGSYDEIDRYLTDALKVVVDDLQPLPTGRKAQYG